MKKIISATVVAALVCLIASCGKDDVAPLYDDYASLKTGNYWIYQLYAVDSNGNGAPLPVNVYDSCYVSKDTVINGNTYYYLTSSGLLNGSTYNKWLRDSLSYVIDNTGQIYFSSEDFSTVFSAKPFIVGPPVNDTVAFITEKMDFTYPTVNTPAGTFSTYDCRTTFLMLPPYDILGKYRYTHRRYAKNVGIVTETLPFVNTTTNYIERRLIRYHVN